MTTREFKWYVEQSKISTFRGGHIIVHWGNFNRINKPQEYYIERHKNGADYYCSFDEGKMQIVGEYFVVKERRYRLNKSDEIITQNIHYKWIKSIQVSLKQKDR